MAGTAWGMVAGDWLEGKVNCREWSKRGLNGRDWGLNGGAGTKRAAVWSRIRGKCFVVSDFAERSKSTPAPLKNQNPRVRHPKSRAGAKGLPPAFGVVGDFMRMENPGW